MSQNSCCVPGCAVVRKDDSKDVLHKFPNPSRDKDRFNAWVYFTGGGILGLSNDHIFKYRRICHKHFEEKYWCRNNLLSNIAVPTKNRPGLTLPTLATKESFRPLRSIQNVLEESSSKVLAPGTSKTTPSIVDNTQTPISSGVDNPDICDEDANADDDSDTLVESNVDNPDICDEDANADDDSDTLVESNVDNPDICDDDANADDDSDTLVESNVCRVCLALDVKLYDLKGIELREMFQNVTGIVVTENNHSTLERLCWECTGKLKAAAAFRSKALLSDALLQGLASSGEQIRKNDITLIKVNEDYLKSFGSLSVTEVFHTVDIDPENDSVPPISKNNDTEIVQNTVRNDSIKLKKIDEDNYQIVINIEDESMIEAPITTEMEYDQFDQISLNTGVESSNNCLETNPVITKNVSFREDKINSVNSSPLPSCSHVEPKYANLGYLLTTPSDSEDKTKEPVTKITNRDSNSKIVVINSKELISAKLKNKNVKKGGISKKTSNLKLVKMSRVKADTPTDEEWLRLEDFD